MKSITIAVFVSMLTLLFSSVSAQQPASRAEDEAAIRKLVTQLQDGWNAGDGKAFAAPFAEDADYVVVNGMYVKGRKAIADGHQNIFDTIYKNSHLAGKVHSIRFIRDGVAVVHVRWQMSFRQNDAMRETRAMNSLVVTKDKGQWSIAAFHNTPIASEK